MSRKLNLRDARSLSDYNKFIVAWDHADKDENQLTKFLSHNFGKLAYNFSSLFGTHDQSKTNKWDKYIHDTFPLDIANERKHRQEEYNLHEQQLINMSSKLRAVLPKRTTRNKKKMETKIVIKSSKPKPSKVVKKQAPVAYGSTQRTTFYRVTQSGDDIVVHCRDRLPIVEFDATVASVASLNISGRVLLAVSLNPSSMGERLRRLSANYEFYRFESAIATYEGATGSSAVGSILGFFDQDPVDGFDAGARSLVEAAAHPGAHSLKIWETGVWVMPSRMGGRYYIDVSGHTAADRRLQEQGVFRIMLDIPLLASSLTSESHNPLGSVYMEYKIRLMKPTLQPNFVGTCDLLIWPTITTINAAAASITNLLESLHAVGYFPVYSGVSNAGITFEVNSTSTGASLSVSEGLWNVSFSATLTLAKATAGAIYEVVFGAATSFGGVPGESGVNSLGSAASNASGTGCSYRVVSTTSALSGRRCNFGFQMLVPADEIYRFVVGITYVSGTDTLVIAEPELVFTSAFPNPTQVAIINPASVDLAPRLRQLEQKINNMSLSRASTNDYEDLHHPTYQDAVLVIDESKSNLFARGHERIVTPGTPGVIRTRSLK